LYRWDFDTLAREEFATLSHVGQTALAEFIKAAVMVDPIEYQRHPGEPSNLPAFLRTLHFGQPHEGLVTFLVYPPDDLVLVVRTHWLGE
jgi:hypothetical protein